MKIMKNSYFNLDSLLSSKGFLIFFSLFLSVALWFFVVGNRNEEIAKTYEVRLEFLNPPSDLALFPSVKTVAITLNGERRAINALQPSQLISEVDLKGLNEGRHNVPIKFKAPSRTTVTQIVPKDVEIELARLIDKELKVRALPPEDMPSGYIMDGVTITPDTVKAHGRQDQLAGIFEVTVRPTKDQLFSGGSWRLPLKAPDGVALDFSPSDVTVSATYYQGMPRKDLPVEVRTRGTLQPSLRLISTKVVPETLPAEGRTEAFEQVKSLQTEPINLSRLTKSTTVQTKIAELPAGLTLLSSPVVTVNIELKTLNDTREFLEIPVDVHGALEGAQWSVEPAGVTVYVEGTSAAVQHLTPEDFGLTAYVDVSNIVAPSLRLPVRLQYKKIAGIESVGVEPVTVKAVRKSD
ncbi:MAG: YbbR-like domain-containing protein [Pyramidobacter sp.]